MKIIRPEQPIKRKEEENLTLVIDGKEVTSFTKEEVEQSFTYSPKQKEETIETLMSDILKEKQTGENQITVTITLTKRQYELYTKKGGEQWIKKVITGQQVKKKSTKKR